MSRKQFRGIASTTHRDRHGERVTKEFLDKQVARFREMGQPMWGYWNHFTTLPPNQVAISQEVERREDGEYQLIIEGELYEEQDYEMLPNSGVIMPVVTEQDIAQALLSEFSLQEGEIQILYDPRNFEPSEVDPIIKSIGEVIPAKRRHYIRKADLPDPVLLVVVAYATGFIARLGELTADKVLHQVSSFYERLHQHFAPLLRKSKTDQQQDVIFNFTLPQSATLIEGAIESADEELLKKAWPKLPKLYCLARDVIQRNRNEYFTHAKFLFNPKTAEWEINYLVTRGTNRVILGSRYSDPAHPLRKRWDDERANFQVSNQGMLGMSIAFMTVEPDEQE